MGFKFQTRQLAASFRATGDKLETHFGCFMAEAATTIALIPPQGVFRNRSGLLVFFLFSAKQLWGAVKC